MLHLNGELLLLTPESSPNIGLQSAWGSFLKQPHQLGAPARFWVSSLNSTAKSLCMPTTLDCALASSLNEDTTIPRRNLHSQHAFSKAPAGTQEACMTWHYNGLPGRHLSAESCSVRGACTCSPWQDMVSCMISDCRHVTICHEHV